MGDSPSLKSYFFWKILKKKTGKKYGFLNLVAEFATPVLEIIDLKSVWKKKRVKNMTF